MKEQFNKVQAGITDESEARITDETARQRKSKVHVR